MSCTLGQSQSENEKRDRTGGAKGLDPIHASETGNREKVQKTGKKDSELNQTSEGFHPGEVKALESNCASIGEKDRAEGEEGANSNTIWDTIHPATKQPCMRALPLGRFGLKRATRACLFDLSGY